MSRQTLLWSLVVFFGASLVFSGLNTATEGESTGLRLAVQVIALVVILAGVVLFMRFRGRGGS